jgi:PAS domain S-box-containing protein
MLAGIPMPSSDSGSLVVDLEGTIAFASSFFRSLVRVGAKKLAGMSFFDFVFPEDVESAKFRLDAGRFAQALPFVLRLRRSNGTSVWTVIQPEPLQTASSEVYGISVTITLTPGPMEVHRGTDTHPERGGEDAYD